MFAYKFKEALWSGVVVSSLIDKILFAHFIDTLVNVGHKLTDRLAKLRLCAKRIYGRILLADL